MNFRHKALDKCSFCHLKTDKKFVQMKAFSYGPTPETNSPKENFINNVFRFNSIVAN